MTISGIATPNRRSITSAYGWFTVTTRLARRAQRRSTQREQATGGPRQPSDVGGIDVDVPRVVDDGRVIAPAEVESDRDAHVGHRVDEVGRRGDPTARQSLRPHGRRDRSEPDCRRRRGRRRPRRPVRGRRMPPVSAGVAVTTGPAARSGVSDRSLRGRRRRRDDRPQRRRQPVDRPRPERGRSGSRIRAPRRPGRPASLRASTVIECPRAASALAIRQARESNAPLEGSTSVARWGAGTRGARSPVAAHSPGPRRA